MANKYNNVIVFGPTGAVGSAVALEASKRGAKVWLAMRNPDKAIPGLSKEQESHGNFARVQADLSDAASVKDAVRKSDAKAAFLYLVHGQEGIAGAVRAFKETGIQYLVFLSTFTIGPHDDIRQISPSEIIPFVHAKAEIALEEAEIPFTALRPAVFASNVINLNLDKSKTPYEAKTIPWPGKWDMIVPRDIGRVGGAILVDPPSTDSKTVVYLCGPHLVTQAEMWEVVNKASSKGLKVVYQSEEEHLQFLLNRNIPPPIAKYLIGSFGGPNSQNQYPSPFYEDSVANIKKYSGYEPTGFEEYAAALQL